MSGLIGTFRLIDVGRDKVNKTVTLRGDQDLWKALKGILMSRDIEYSYDPDTGKGDIFVGGFRRVGGIERIVGKV